MLFAIFSDFCILKEFVYFIERYYSMFQIFEEGTSPFTYIHYLGYISKLSICTLCEAVAYRFCIKCFVEQSESYILSLFKRYRDTKDWYSALPSIYCMDTRNSSERTATVRSNGACICELNSSHPHTSISVHVSWNVGPRKGIAQIQVSRTNE